MQFDGFSLLMIIIADLVAIFLIYASGKQFETRLVSIIALACFNFSSCIGIIMNKDNSSYIASAMLFLVLMVLVNCQIMNGKYILKFGNHSYSFLAKDSYEKAIRPITILGILCLVIVAVSTIYPTNYFAQITQSSFSITGQRFALKISRSSGLAWVMDRIKLVLMPFFFIWLYTLRDNWRKFVSLFLAYSFCIMLQNSLITSRSNYLQAIIFILIYLTLEKKISRRQLVITSIIIGVIGIVVMVWFKDLIMGKSNTYSGFGGYAQALLQSEYSGGQARLDYCNSVSGELNFFHYLYHCFTAPLFFLPDDGFPTLSYYFTTGVLGLRYGQVGYYVILPGAFGEGVMVLGKAFAWIYGVFIGLFSGLFFRFLRKHDYLRYVYVYFLIQFGFAFRGGIQAFVMRSFNCLVYFLIVMALIQGFSRSQKTAYREFGTRENVSN